MAESSSATCLTKLQEYATALYSMQTGSFLTLQALIFALVTAAFTNIYITQPVLPVLSAEFGINESTASFTVSAVILGIALSNLPFGRLADRYSIRPIILTGGLIIAIAGFFCAVTGSFWLLTGARFLQGLFIPGLTTCLAAFLAKNLPSERLNVAMGSYVSATVVGGLGGRLLGGWIHPPLHWRYAFVSASILLLTAVVIAVFRLPSERAGKKTDEDELGFIQLLLRADLGIRRHLPGGAGAGPGLSRGLRRGHGYERDHGGVGRLHRGAGDGRGSDLCAGGAGCHARPRQCGYW